MNKLCSEAQEGIDKAWEDPGLRRQINERQLTKLRHLVKPPVKRSGIRNMRKFADKRRAPETR